MRDNQAAFTLIEFMVAILILMVGLLGLLEAVNMAYSKTAETAFRNEGLTVANERITQCSALRFSDLVMNKWTTMSRAPRGVFKNYSVQTVVTDLTTGPVDNGVVLANTASKQVVVNVAWRLKGTRYTHSVTSIVSTSNTAQ